MIRGWVAVVKVQVLAVNANIYCPVSLEVWNLFTTKLIF